MSSTSIFAILAFIAMVCVGAVIFLQMSERGDYQQSGMWPDYTLSSSR